MKQAGRDKDMGKDMGKDKGDKKGDGKPKVLKLCDVTDLCGFCSAGFSFQLTYTQTKLM